MSCFPKHASFFLITPQRGVSPYSGACIPVRWPASSPDAPSQATLCLVGAGVTCTRAFAPTRSLTFLFLHHPLPACEYEADMRYLSSMTCEKQFIPQDERYVYCSEACRKYDQGSSSNPSAYPIPRTQEILGGNLPFYAAGHPEPRDIIPRASPSRPSSNYFSPPTTPTSTQYTTAISALRSLNTRPPSPPSPTTASAAMWPFTRSAAVSPSTSYSKPTNFYSSTYDGGYGASGYGYGHTSTGAGGLDRPLPSRKPGTKGRPKSIELVAPMVGR